MKNKFILYLIKTLSKFLTPVDFRVSYKTIDFQNNTVESVKYPLSYILSTHSNNINRSFTVDKDFRLEIDVDK